MKKLFILALVVLGFASVSFGQLSASANASAIVKDGLKISNTVGTAMNFGDLTVGAIGGGSIILSPTASIDATSVGAGNYALGGSPANAEFTVEGPANVAFGLTLPADGVEIANISGDGSKMTISNWTASTAVTGLHTAAGSLKFTVGGKLIFGKSQPNGNYTGPFTVSVQYE